MVTSLLPGAPLITITIWTQALNAILLTMVLICRLMLIITTGVMENYTNNRLQNIIDWNTRVLLIILSAFLLFAGSGSGEMSVSWMTLHIFFSRNHLHDLSRHKGAGV